MFESKKRTAIRGIKKWIFWSTLLVALTAFLMTSLINKYAYDSPLPEKINDTKASDIISILLTVDSIVTGATYTLIVVSVFRNNEENDLLQRHLYWKNVIFIKEKNKKTKIKEAYWIFGVGLSPAFFGSITILLTSIETLALFTNLTIVAIICLIITFAILFITLFRTILFQKCWVMTFVVECRKNNPYHIESVISRLSLLAELKSEKLKGHPLYSLYREFTFSLNICGLSWINLMNKYEEENSSKNQLSSNDNANKIDVDGDNTNIDDKTLMDDDLVGHDMTKKKNDVQKVKKVKKKKRKTKKRKKARNRRKKKEK